MRQTPYLIHVSCPSCYSSDCARVARHGLRDFLLRLIGKFPWECSTCMARFYLQRRARS